MQLFFFCILMGVQVENQGWQGLSDCNIQRVHGMHEQADP